jgi:hypothetical protein
MASIYSIHDRAVTRSEVHKLTCDSFAIILKFPGRAHKLTTLKAIFCLEDKLYRHKESTGIHEGTEIHTVLQ